MDTCDCDGPDGPIRPSAASSARCMVRRKRARMSALTICNNDLPSAHDQCDQRCDKGCEYCVRYQCACFICEVAVLVKMPSMSFHSM